MRKKRNVLSNLPKEALPKPGTRWWDNMNPEDYAALEDCVLNWLDRKPQTWTHFRTVKHLHDYLRGEHEIPLGGQPLVDCALTGFYAYVKHMEKTHGKKA